MKLNKLIKKVTKAIKSPNMDDAGISLGVAQLLTMLTANRKTPVVMVIIEDEEDPERTKILTKFIGKILKIFGIKPINMKAIKKSKLFKGKKKKVVEKVTRFNNNVKGCRLSKDGADLKKLLLCFYELELRQSGMSNLKNSDPYHFFDREETRACVKNLLRTFTATNLQYIDQKKICKRLSDKDKAAVKAYKELRKILMTMETPTKLPKVEYGQKKKKGKAIGAKMKTKKFVKFFEKKKKNRSLLIPIYGHILARLLDYNVGEKEYNSHMKSVFEPFGSDVAKSYIAAANAAE